MTTYCITFTAEMQCAPRVAEFEYFIMLCDLCASAKSFLARACMDKSKRIAQLVQEACIREVCASKPGNVGRHHDFSDTSLEDFLISAVAIGPAFEVAALKSVGQIVLQAIEDCRLKVRTNTNLGIVLLLAPLAKAALESDRKLLRESLQGLLQALTVDDACLVYRAIRMAGAGGLGSVPVQDVSGEPTVTLLEAMRLARDRDSVASEYVTGFEITFETGWPALKQALSEGTGFPDATVHAFLTILARVPDTLIARKSGWEISRHVSRRAADILSQGGVFTSRGKEKILELDRAIRDDDHKLNPGTTADLTTAAIFLCLLEGWEEDSTAKRPESC